MYSVSEPCNATWTLYRASNAFGGSRLSTANDVTTCLQGCNANRRCRAADYNASSPIGRRCFLHFSTGAARVNVGLFTAVSHYSISRVCPSTYKNVPLQGSPKSCTFFFGTVQDKMKRISPKCFFLGTFSWNPFHFILNGSKDLVRWKVYNVFGTPCKWCLHVPSVLWHYWLGARKGIQFVKIEWWGVGLVICLERGADCLHMVQLMPLPSQNLLPHLNAVNTIHKTYGQVRHNFLSKQFFFSFIHSNIRW